MKKWLLVALTGLVIGTMVFADHPKDKFGIGPSIRLGPGNIVENGDYWDYGVLLKPPRVPLFMGIHTRFQPSDTNLTFTGDFYFVDNNIVETDGEGDSYKFKLDWYLGIGLHLGFGFWNTWGKDWGYHDADFKLGIRMPVGVSWHITESIEMVSGVAITFPIFVFPFTYPFSDDHLRDHFLRWWVPFDFGFRFWI